MSLEAKRRSVEGPVEGPWGLGLGAGSFVKDKVPIGMWVCLWALYLVPLFYISFLCQHHIVLMTVDG